VSRSTKDDPKPDFAPDDATDEGVHAVPEVWRGADRALGERPAPNWGELDHLPGVGSMLRDARQFIETRGAITAIEVGESTAARIANAETADDILADDGTIDFDRLVGQRFTIRKVEWALSDVAGDYPCYAVLHCAHWSTGREFVTTTSALDVMLKAHALDKRGMLPVDVALKQTDVTRQGFKALKLVRPHDVI